MPSNDLYKLLSRKDAQKKTFFIRAETLASLVLWPARIKLVLMIIIVIAVIVCCSFTSLYEEV